MQWLKRFNRNGSNINAYKPVVLVTGCASGVGLAMADLLWSKRYYRVVITCRAHSLGFLRSRFPEDKTSFIVRSLDVSKEHEREALIQEITALWGGVDILVNNAGVSYRAVVEHMTEVDEKLQMATNYLGPMGLIRLVLPRMREQGRGKIINVSSVSGMLAMPTMAAYSASKHALEGASEALWYETRPLGISVSLIQPGFIRSNSFEKVRFSYQSKQACDSSEPYSDYYQNMGPFISRLMSMSLSTPESVAALILRAIQTENPPLWIPATLDAYVFYMLRRLLPRRILLPVLYLFLPRSNSWGELYTNRRGTLRSALRSQVEMRQEKEAV